MYLITASYCSLIIIIIFLHEYYILLSLLEILVSNPRFIDASAAASDITVHLSYEKLRFHNDVKYLDFYFAHDKIWRKQD